MAYNSINNTIRFTGLASGLDTESIVKNLMQAEKFSVQKVERKKQVSEWRQELYQEVTNSLRSFKSKYFDYLNPSSNMLSNNTYKQFSVTSSDISVVKAEGTYEALESNHTVKVNNIATASSVKSDGGISKNVRASDRANFASAEGKSFILSIDGTSHTIKIDQDVTDALSLQTAIDDTIGSGKVSVSDTSGILSFNTVEGSGVHKISVSSGTDDTLEYLGFNVNSSVFSNRVDTYMTLEDVSKRLNESFQFDSGKLSITINDETFTFDKKTPLYQVINEINSNEEAGVTLKYNELTDEFEFYSKKTGEGQNIKFQNDSGGFFNALNLCSTSGNSAISDLSAMDFSGVNAQSLTLVIDGQKQQITFNTDYSSDTDYSNFLNDLEDKIEAAYGLEADSITSSIDGNNILSFELSSGEGSLLIGETETGSILSTLGLEANYIGGEDAEVLVDGEKVVRSSNSFTIEGIKYTVLKKSTEDQTLSLELDTNKIYEKISNFVEDYNNLISELNNKINEEYDTDYQPLTDEEKEGMSEEEIELWEKRAKTGLLRNDSIIKDLLTNMRTALYDSIDNMSVSLYSIGITTGGYEENGQLHIDENELKEAINNNPDSVMNLFSKAPTNNVTNVRALSSEDRIERYAEEGLAYRFYDILEDNISTYRDENDRKGLLLEKAGLDGDVSQYTNYLYKQIQDYDEELDELYEKLADKEESYYARFTALETAMSQLQSQSDYITSMLGG